MGDVHRDPGAAQEVYAWTSVPHEPDGITTMRYALARLVLADGDRGDLVLAYTTAGEAVAPTDSERVSDCLCEGCDLSLEEMRL